MKFSGFSGPFGITFFGDKYKAELSTDFKISWKGIKVHRHTVTVKKTVIKHEQMILFGVFILVDILFNFSHVIISIIDNLISKIPVSVPQEVTHTASKIPIIEILILFELILIALFIWSMKYTKMYHGSEHKVISAAENNDLQNAKNYSRIHPRCGTNLIPMYIVYVIVFSTIFNPYKLAGMSMIMSLFTLKYIPIIDKLSIIIGNKLQLLTTKEPSEQQLNNAIKSLELLIKTENEGLLDKKKVITLD